jgi:hypothetical protein
MADEADEIKKGFSKKIAAGAGGGIIAFTSIVFAYIDNKTEAINQRINDNAFHAKEYIDKSNRDIDDKLNRIESVLVRIDDKIYEIIKSQPKQEL